MAEEAQAGPETGEEQPENHEPEFEGEFDPERAKRTIGNLRATEKQLKAQVAELVKKAQKLDELEEAEKTEQERLTEQLNQATEKLQALERQSLRNRIALEKGVPAQLASRLQGETEEELAADADALLSLVTSEQHEPSPPRASPRQGTRETPALNDDDPLLRDLKSKLGIQ